MNKQSESIHNKQNNEEGGREECNARQSSESKKMHFLNDDNADPNVALKKYVP